MTASTTRNWSGSAWSGGTDLPREAFRYINDVDAATVERIAARLEFRGTAAGYVAFRAAYFAKLPLATARRILALGCGTGTEVRAPTRRPAFAGAVVGVGP